MTERAFAAETCVQIELSKTFDKNFCRTDGAVVSLRNARTGVKKLKQDMEGGGPVHGFSSSACTTTSALCESFSLLVQPRLGRSRQFVK